MPGVKSMIRLGRNRFTAIPSLVAKAHKAATGMAAIFRGYKVRKAAKAIAAAKKIQGAFRNRLYYHETMPNRKIVRYKRRAFPAARPMNRPRALNHMLHNGFKMFKRRKIGNVRSSFR